MIYKCKNCGLEYAENPEYCDCGNNVFICLNNGVPLEEEFSTSENYENYDNYESVNDDYSESKQQTVAYNDEYDYEDDAEYEDNAEYVNTSQYENPAQYQNDSGYEYNAEYQKPAQYAETDEYEEDDEDDDESEHAKSFSLYVAIFIFSFISILAIILIVRAITAPSNNTPKVAKPKVSKEITIPDVDSYWIDSKSKPSNATNSVSEVEVVASADMQEVSTPAPVQVQEKTAASVQKPQPQQVQKDKTPKQTASKPRKTEVKKTQTKPQDVQPKQKDKQASATQNKTNVQKPATAVKNTNSAKELSDYKVALRKRLFSVFPILNVSGFGSATIGFTISKDGKLLNRHFVKQSDNKSLNDAMYHMLMRTPSFNPPPESYSGEQIILRMDYNNGSYSFSYQ